MLSESNNNDSFIRGSFVGQNGSQILRIPSSSIKSDLTKANSYSSSIQSFNEDDYITEGPINQSLGVYFARRKKDELTYCSVMKKLIFRTQQDQEICVQAITEYTQTVIKAQQLLQQPATSQGVSQSTIQGILLPKGISTKNYIGKNQYTVCILFDRKIGSLQDEIERRQMNHSFLSSDEIRALSERLVKLISLGNIPAHLNIKPANILVDENANYILTEGGFQQMIETTDHQVFTAPEIKQIQAEEDDNGFYRKQIELKSLFSVQADIYSIGMCLLQAATLKQPEDIILEGNEPLLQEVKDKYGPDIFSLIKNMTLEDTMNRATIEQIRQNYLKRVMLMLDPQYNPQDQEDTPTPNDIECLKRIKSFCAEYCSKRSQSLIDFIGRSEAYDRITKTITKYELMRIFEMIGLSISDSDLKSLQKTLDGQKSGKYNLTEFFRDTQAIGNNKQQNADKGVLQQDDLPSLSNNEEETTLANALKRTYHYARREKINLERQLKEADRDSTGSISFADLRKVLQGNGIMFREEETELIERKFDVDFTKKQINYIKLIAAIHRSVTIGENQLQEELRAILRSIMVSSISFEDFISRLASDNKNSFATTEIVLAELERDNSLKISSILKTKLIELLDPHGSGHVYTSGVVELMQPYLQEEIMRIILDLAGQLQRKNISFEQFGKSYLPPTKQVNAKTLSNKMQDIRKIKEKLIKNGYG